MILSVAPMMDYTDRHYRYLIRLLSRRTTLYTEMIPDSAILLGNREKFLKFDESEHPVVLQLGGSDANQLAKCARIGEDYGYNAINLNCGCPSDRVEKGNFGASLMATPEKVADIVEKIQKAVSIPVSVKHRIGIRSPSGLNKDQYSNLVEFVNIVSKSGINHFIVHARIAVLAKLTPAQNRSIPPLDYNTVYQLKRDFRHLTIEINGGISSLEESVEQLKYVDGVMIGRSAVNNPYLFANADQVFFNEKSTPLSRTEVIQAYLPYVYKAMTDEKIRVHHALRHVANLYSGQPGGRLFRRFLSEKIFTKKEDWQPNGLEKAMNEALSYSR
ncbi:MAG: tRNA dihydrouridine(20/20a) synthase DusA [Leptonema sp. (in: Bacteria)]|nr:tRNA dihydrouridine(20/20a) synthase DusA [Leptonema sp. (in: bacteria)]